VHVANLVPGLFASVEVIKVMLVAVDRHSSRSASMLITFAGPCFVPMISTGKARKLAWSYGTF
jgi:hypothetical protein